MLVVSAPAAGAALRPGVINGCVHGGIVPSHAPLPASVPVGNFDTFRLAEHHFQHEGCEYIPNIVIIEDISGRCLNGTSFQRMAFMG